MWVQIRRNDTQSWPCSNIWYIHCVSINTSFIVLPQPQKLTTQSSSSAWSIDSFIHQFNHSKHLTRNELFGLDIFFFIALLKEGVSLQCSWLRQQSRSAVTFNAFMVRSDAIGMIPGLCCFQLSHENDKTETQKQTQKSPWCKYVKTLSLGSSSLLFSLILNV